MNASVLVIKCFQLKCNNLHSEYFYFGYFEYILTLLLYLLLDLILYYSHFLTMSFTTDW